MMRCVRKFFLHWQRLARSPLARPVLLRLLTLVAYLQGQRDLPAKAKPVIRLSNRLSKFSCIRLS
ncbi:peptide chain release factor 2 [Chlamydia felis Fe/C-56]|uniref:Peptide chain release factor 2 n=1 Tax=Chlamydia felis (strain Fe/C-56) TaxID=264202 RepID=Q253C4_CHLFF|nr:peptide chain release factor 2 [Chlamydia felis Fe/C-56]